MDTMLVDAATVAAKLGQAKSRVYRLAQAGLIPSYAAGPRLRGRRFDLMEVREALKALAKEKVQLVDRENRATSGGPKA